MKYQYVALMTHIIFSWWRMRGVEKEMHFFRILGREFCWSQPSVADMCLSENLLSIAREFELAQYWVVFLPQWENLSGLVGKILSSVLVCTLHTAQLDLVGKISLTGLVCKAWENAQQSGMPDWCHIFFPRFSRNVCDVNTWTLTHTLMLSYLTIIISLIFCRSEFNFDSFYRFSQKQPLC